MHSIKQLLLAVTFITLVFVDSQAIAQDNKAYTILDVNGEKIPSSEVEGAWAALFPEGAAPEFDGFDEDVKQNVLRGLVSERLLYNEAKKAGITERDSVKRRLETLQKQIIIQAYIEELTDSFVTEASVKQAYADYTEKSKKEEEVRAGHILVETQEEAQNIVKKLKAGTDFAKLAKSVSSDKGSAASGGDLGYFTKEKMVPEFASAAFNLKRGEVSEPVKSQFGWHIIKLEDRRPMKVASFEDMQEQLKAQVRKQGIDRYVSQLMEKAEVKYFAADGKRKELKLTR